MKLIRFVILTVSLGLSFCAATAHGEDGSELNRLSADPELAKDMQKHSTNIHTNVLMLAAGFWNLDADFAISPHFTLGPTFMYLKSSHENTAAMNGQTISSYSSKMTAPALGVRAYWYPFRTHAESGLVLSPFVRIARINVSENDNGRETEDTFPGTETGLMISYQLATALGFNMSFGGGMSYLMAFPEVTTDIDQYHSVQVPGKSTAYLDISTGWMF